MSNNLTDLIKSLAGKGNGSSSSDNTNNGPQFGSKPVSENTVPEFKSKTEFFTQGNNKIESTED